MVQRDGWVRAQKDFQPDFDARQARAKIPLVLWTGYPSCYSAAHPATGAERLPVQSGQRSADREYTYQLRTQFPFAPRAGHRRICRDLAPNDNSIQQERRKSRRAFGIPPMTLARRPYAGMRQVGETNQCETRVSGGRGVCGAGAGSRGIGPNWSGARCGSQTKERPLPFETEGKG